MFLKDECDNGDIVPVTDSAEFKNVLAQIYTNPHLVGGFIDEMILKNCQDCSCTCTGDKNCTCGCNSCKLVIFNLEIGVKTVA